MAGILDVQDVANAPRHNDETEQEPQPAGRRVQFRHHGEVFANAR